MASKAIELNAATVNAVLDQLEAVAAAVGSASALASPESEAALVRVQAIGAELSTALSRGRGLRPSELITTRIVQLVSGIDEINRLRPEADPIPIGGKPLAYSCRRLARILEATHPGRSIEVRIPPYAAIQCSIAGEGPTHTRGTPPNVVETDPITFLRLATGREDWSAARSAGRVSASGQRADISAALPILRWQ